MYWIAKYNSWEPVSVLEWTLSVMLHGPRRLEHLPCSHTILQTLWSHYCSSHVSKAVLSHLPCRVWFCCSWSVDGENAAFALFARFMVCSVLSLHAQWIHITMNCPSDPLSQTTAASKHTQYAGPAKAICLGSPKNLCPQACYKRLSLTMHHRDVSSWEQFCIRVEEGGFAPRNCHRTVRHSRTTESCPLLGTTACMGLRQFTCLKLGIHMCRCVDTCQHLPTL